MKALITVGCMTDHGGIISIGDSSFLVEGKAIHLDGMTHYCPKCRVQSRAIASNQGFMIVGGKSIVADGDTSSCGSRYIKISSMAVMTNGSGSGSSSISLPISSQQPLQNSLVAETKTACPPECVVETVSFNTSPGPYIISMETWKKILEFEEYKAKPYQPGDNVSGVTIAIGYDLGQQSAAQIQKDLAPYYTKDQIEQLLKAQGKKGAAAKAMIPSLSDITISKDNAYKLATALKTRYAEQVLSVYPETLDLHPHCQGVLLSLVFNRGPAMKDPKNGLTRIHMRQIRDALKANTPEKIPDIMREMSKLWNKTGPKGNSGVGKRRREEADIFEKGVKCDCYK